MSDTSSSRSSRSRGWSQRIAATGLATAVVALQGATAWTSFVGHAPSVDQRPSTLPRRAGFDRERLEKEASFTEGLMQSFSNLFAPKPPTPDENAKARRAEMNKNHEKMLRGMKLSVVVGDDGGELIRRTAPIAVLQTQARQNLVLFGASRPQVLTDLFLSMRLSLQQFSQKNVLVVPILLDTEKRTMAALPDSLKSSKMLLQGCVALPAMGSSEDGDEWGTLMSNEWEQVVEQKLADQAVAQGLAILVKRNGEIVKRGVGRPDWDIVFRELAI